MPRRTRKTETQWRAVLTPEQYRVLRQGRTEQPFSGRYNELWDRGVYFCAACRTPLFSAEVKYDHGTGWPSFSAPLDERNIVYRDDYSLLMKRVEVRCAVCGSHLGHVFDDGPAPTFLHYCINSAALEFVADRAAGDLAAGPVAKPSSPAPKDHSGRARKRRSKPVS